MEAAAHGHSTLGIPKKVGQEFVGHGDLVVKRKKRRRRANDIEVKATVTKPTKVTAQIDPVAVERPRPRLTAHDVGLAHDAAIALDRSVRSYDADGHLHVARTPISKANICPYVGSEIPDYEQLGLDPKKLYQMLRHPDELAKAAPTFKGKPILTEHEPTSAEDHQGKLTVGAIDDEPVFEDPYLYSSLVFWPQDAIDLIEDETQKQLSAAYRYVPDMTPGVWKGVPYDGVMRDIIGNHVALVKEGRAGADVMVGDSALTPPLVPSEKLLTVFATNACDPRQESEMPESQVTLSPQGKLVMDKLSAFLKGKVTKDVSIPQAVFCGITDKNYKTSRPALDEALGKYLKGKLAQDASLGDIHGLLDSLTPKEDAAPAAALPPSSALPMMASAPKMDDDPMHGMIREHLAGKLAPDDIEDLLAKLKGGGEEKGEDEWDDEEDKGEDEIGSKVTAEMTGHAADDPPPFPGAPKVGKGPAQDSKPKGKPMDDTKRAKAAMDAAMAKMAADNALAITQAKADTEKSTIARLNGISEAKEKVRPWVGQLPGAYDSGEAVLRQALRALNIKDADKLHADALAPILEAQPKANQRTGAIPTTMASDAKSDIIPFHEMFPDAKRIGFAH